MDIRTTQLLGRLVDFAVDRGLIESIDRCYYTNRLLECMHMDAPAPAEPESFPVPETATPILEPLVDIAVARGLCGETGEQRDLFSAKLMGIVTPSPREVRRSFEMTLHAQGIEAATKWFYRLCRNCDYIKVDRVARNAHFFEETGAGRLEITINLSKPEKDPRDIAAQRNAPKTGYPKCMLCAENPGYAGRVGFPARQDHRMLPLLLDGKLWFFQYSPYLYYNEHCIVINNEHVPMRISHDTFVRLFDFVDRFPHYFLGSNADLPIVGGSILSHDHFQGGNHVFPLDLARVRIPLASPAEGVEAGILDWPMSCVRLCSEDRDALIRLADELLAVWRAYSDPECGILAETDQPHNTLTPILRRQSGQYVLNLVLRNNRTSVEHPLGIFHPHADLHHIKKENIGLIEVMGLMILPGRLLSELSEVEKYICGEIPALPAEMSAHTEWAETLRTRFDGSIPADRLIRKGLGEKCARVLTDAGVYKQTEDGDRGFLRFLHAAGYR